MTQDFRARLRAGEVTEEELAPIRERAAQLRLSGEVTEAELDAFELHLRRLSYSAIASQLGIVKGTARDRIERAWRKVNGVGYVDDRVVALRGIPAVGPGVGGAIRGTRPDHEVLRRS